jgi:hypothetical protein
MLLNMLAALSLAAAPTPIYPNNQIDPHYDGIRQVVCWTPDGTSNGKGWTGTMFHVGENSYITAFHVSDGGACFDEKTGTPLSAIHTDSEKDFTIFISPTKLDDVILKVSCKPYEQGQEYISFGWVDNVFHAISLKPTSNYTLKSFEVEGKPSVHLRILHNLIIPGMSGGPVVDTNWVVHGINNAFQPDRKLSLSRELADTILCK